MSRPALYRVISFRTGGVRAEVYQGGDGDRAHAIAGDERASGAHADVMRLVPEHWEIDSPCQERDSQGRRCVRSNLPPHTFHLFAGTK